MSSYSCGIDLGTTNSAIGYVDPQTGAVKCVPNPINKQNTHPSVVYIPKDPLQPIIVGCEAQNTGKTQPLNTIYSVKRLMGRYLSQQELSNLNTTINYKVTTDTTGHTIIPVPQDDGTDGIYTPIDISAYILTHLKNTSEAFFNPPEFDSTNFRPVYQAVITVPADFSCQQRYATRLAAKMAGLDVLRIISEPSAAAINYCFNHFYDPNKQHEHLDGSKVLNLLVFDLGGGTFDVSIVSVSREGFCVRASTGNNAFGGHDIDNRIADDIKSLYIKECQQRHKLTNITQFPTTLKAMRKLREVAQHLKESLTTSMSYKIEMEKDDFDLDIPIFSYEYKRARLDALLSKMYNQHCAPVVDNALYKAGLKSYELYQIVLVGGSTRSLAFSNLISKQLSVPISKAINPDEAVALGAAILAESLSSRLAQKDLVGAANAQEDSRNSTSIGNNNSSTTTMRRPMQQQQQYNTTTAGGGKIDGKSFTEMSLSRGELSSFGYAIGAKDEVPVMLIPPGSELLYNTEGEYTFFLRHPEPDSEDGRAFDWSKPITFYIYEGEDSVLSNNPGTGGPSSRTPSVSFSGSTPPVHPPLPSTTTTAVAAESNVITPSSSNLQDLSLDVVAAQQPLATSINHRHLLRLFEVTVTRQQKATQVISFLLKLDADGILTAYISDGEDYYEIADADKPEVQVLIQQHFAEDSGPSTVTEARTRQLLLDHLQLTNSTTTNEITTITTTNAPILPNRPAPQPTTTGGGGPGSLQRQPSLVNVNKKQQLPPPPPPRAPKFERIILPSIYDPTTQGGVHPPIPPPPKSHPSLAVTLADKFLNGYANVDYVFMRSCRDRLVDEFINPVLAPSASGGMPTTRTPTQSMSTLTSPRISTNMQAVTITKENGLVLQGVPTSSVFGASARRPSIAVSPHSGADGPSREYSTMRGSISRPVASLSRTPSETISNNNNNNSTTSISPLQQHIPPPPSQAAPQLPSTYQNNNNNNNNTQPKQTTIVLNMDIYGDDDYEDDNPFAAPTPKKNTTTSTPAATTTLPPKPSQRPPQPIKPLPSRPTSSSSSTTTTTTTTLPPRPTGALPALPPTIKPPTISANLDIPKPQQQQQHEQSKEAEKKKWW